MVHDYSLFGSTADFVIKREHLGFLTDLAISKLLLYTSTESTCICKIVHFPRLKSVKSSYFPNQLLEGADAGCLTLRSYLPLAIYMVHDNSLFGSTADFVIKREHLGFLTDLAISKRQRRQVEI
jgi:hypothetical protein